ncbi:MAG: hypothetical protein U1D30_19625 [Planctomycetota bacterium]
MSAVMESKVLDSGKFADALRIFDESMAPITTMAYTPDARVWLPSGKPNPRPVVRKIPDFRKLRPEVRAELNSPLASEHRWRLEDDAFARRSVSDIVIEDYGAYHEVLTGGVVRSLRVHETEPPYDEMFAGIKLVLVQLNGQRVLLTREQKDAIGDPSLPQGADPVPTWNDDIIYNLQIVATHEELPDIMRFLPKLCKAGESGKPLPAVPGCTGQTSDVFMTDAAKQKAIKEIDTKNIAKHWLI